MCVCGGPESCRTSTRATTSGPGLGAFTPGWHRAFNCGLLCGGGWGVDCGGPPCATPRLNLPLGPVPNPISGGCPSWLLPLLEMTSGREPGGNQSEPGSLSSSLVFWPPRAPAPDKGDTDKFLAPRGAETYPCIVCLAAGAGARRGRCQTVVGLLSDRYQTVTTPLSGSLSGPLSGLLSEITF